MLTSLPQTQKLFSKGGVMLESKTAQKLKIKKIDVRTYERPVQMAGTGDCSLCGTCPLTDKRM